MGGWRERLTEARLKCGMTQEMVGKELGFDRKSIARAERYDRGEPGLGKVLAMAKLYGVSLDWLFEEEDTSKTQTTHRNVEEDSEPQAERELKEEQQDEAEAEPEIVEVPKEEPEEEPETRTTGEWLWTSAFGVGGTRTMAMCSLCKKQVVMLGRIFEYCPRCGSAMKDGGVMIWI